MNRNEISENVHKNAVEHGLWDVRNSNEHCLMLIYTEVAELVEAYRKSLVADKQKFNEWLLSGDSHELAFEKFIKISFEDKFADIYIRLADIYIRLADLAGALGIDFDNMRTSRYYREFDRFSLTENAFTLIKILSDDRIGIKKRIQLGMGFIEDWTKQHGVNLEWHISQKMKYNQSREIMHGKKY